MNNTYTLTHETVANLKEGDRLSLTWDVYSIGDEFLLHLKDSFTGQDNFAEAKDLYGWTVTPKAETPEPFTPTPSVDARLIAMAILTAAQVIQGRIAWTKDYECFGVDDEKAVWYASDNLEQILKNL